MKNIDDVDKWVSICDESAQQKVVLHQRVVLRDEEDARDGLVELGAQNIADGASRLARAEDTFVAL